MDEGNRTGGVAVTTRSNVAMHRHGGGTMLPVGTLLHEFEILDLIGEGGFAFVYLAKDHSLERIVALKEFMPSSLAVRQDDGTVLARTEQLESTFQAGLRSFVNEARLLAQFDHPALLKVYRFWQGNGTAYMAMPYYEGITLKKAILDNRVAVSESWLKQLLAPITDAVETLHGVKCYHRDISPDNIQILKSGRPLLLDFGAARRIIGDATHGVTVILKPGYAPIEQYAEDGSGQQGPWTDIYALSAVIFFCITGKAPPASVARSLKDTMPSLRAHVGDRFSQDFLTAVERGLEVHPSKRPQSIRQFRSLLHLPRYRVPDGFSEQPDDAAEQIRTGPKEDATGAPAMPGESHEINEHQAPRPDATPGSVRTFDELTDAADNVPLPRDYSSPDIPEERRPLNKGGGDRLADGQHTARDGGASIGDVTGSDSPGDGKHADARWTWRRVSRFVVLGCASALILAGGAFLLQRWSVSPEGDRKVSVANDAEQAKRVARQKADEEAKRVAQEKAEADARRQAQQRAEEEAKVLPRQRADEEAKRVAQQKAEADAKRQAQQRADEEAKRVAQQNAEADAKRQAQQKADEEAKRVAQQKAEAEAKRVAQQKADEEAKRLAQEKAEQAKAEQLAKEERARREEEARQLQIQQKAELDQKTSTLRNKIAEQDLVIRRLETTIAALQQRGSGVESANAAKEREAQLELARTELLLAQREKQRANSDIATLVNGSRAPGAGDLDDEIQTLRLKIARLRGALDQLQSQRDDSTRQDARRPSTLPVITP